MPYGDCGTERVNHWHHGLFYYAQTKAPAADDKHHPPILPWIADGPLPCQINKLSHLYKHPTCTCLFDASASEKIEKVINLSMLTWEAHWG